MQRPLQITFRGMEHSDAIAARIHSEADELENFYDHITGCHVTVEAPRGRHQHGGLFSVRLEIFVPQGDLVVSREGRHDHAHEDVYVAIRDAFAAGVRQLEDYARRRNGASKVHETPTHGVVAKLFLDECYGFATMSDGGEVYFHQNSVVNGRFSSLHVGDEVRLTVAEVEGEKGPQASTVTPIGKHHLMDDPRA